jgi:hypothetical protein
MSLDVSCHVQARLYQPSAVFSPVVTSAAPGAKFVSDPERKKLSKMPEYSDKAILCGITNLILKPAEYSRI